MTKPDTAAVAKILEELAQRMELEGANPYRARAYGRAAENLSLSTVPLDQLIAEDRLQEIPGVGEALAAVITKIYRTGGHSGLEALRDKIPTSALEMLRIPGMRPDRVKRLYTDLGIASVAELEKAARAGRMEKVKGFGPAFQAKTLQGIEMLRGPTRLHIHRAAAALEQARRQLSRQHPAWESITPAGEFRRGCELVGPLSLVAVDPSLEDQTQISKKGGQLTLHVSSPERYGITLLLATGSQAHLHALQALARKKGYALTSRGLLKSRSILAQRAEADIYKALGLQYIPPELRETGEEVKRAAAGKLTELVGAKAGSHRRGHDQSGNVRLLQAPRSNNPLYKLRPLRQRLESNELSGFRGKSTGGITARFPAKRGVARH